MSVHSQYRAWLLLAPLASVVAACGGGGGSPSGTATPSPTATLAPAPTPTPSPSPTPTPAPTGSFASQAAALYDVQPDLATCRAGVLKSAVKADLLARLNAIRALHGLPAVTYSEAETAAEQEGALMMVVNSALSHNPPASWACYTARGADAAGGSNLYGAWGQGLSFGTEDDVLAAWLREGGTASIGHRRWILSPFLGQTSYGRVVVEKPDGSRSTASLLRVFGFANPATLPPANAIPDFVAYPMGDYPARYFQVADYLSFSAIAGKTGSFGGNERVSFARAFCG